MKTLSKLSLLSFILIILIQCQKRPSSIIKNRWSEERAWEWEKDHGWMVGTNFNPSTSVNQLEFWQQDTYDQETIEREGQLKFTSGRLNYYATSDMYHKYSVRRDFAKWYEAVFRM